MFVKDRYDRAGFFKAVFAVCVVLFAVAVAVGNATEVQAKDKDGNYVIIIDAGHGSGDPGAVSLNGDREAVLNWNIAMALKAELQTYAGVKVYLTRGSAEPFSNTGRGRLGELLGADYAISIHNNSGSSSASGVICFGTVNATYKTAAQNMGHYIAAEVAPYVGWGAYNGYSNRASEFYDGNSQVDYYTFIDEAVKCNIPALIVEHCYLSNAGNSAFIHDINNQYKLGYADATGIAKCLGLSKRTVAAGSSVTLTRTYSAYMTGAKGTFTSSNPAVCKVRSDGLITAVGAGTATVTCTAQDGSKHTVKVTVPQVKLVGIAAGITPTMYKTREQALAFKKNMVVVKGIYSDGTAAQVSGAKVGNAVCGNTKNYPYYNTAQGVNAVTEVNAPVSYGGFNCNLKMYYGPDLYLGNYSTSNYVPSGANADILHIPAGYTSVAGSTIPSVTPPVTVTPSQGQTSSPPPAESTGETEDESDSTGEESSEYESNNEVDGTAGSENTTVAASRENDHIDVPFVIFIIVCILLVGLVAGITVLAVYKNNRKKRRRYRVKRRNK